MADDADRAQKRIDEIHAEAMRRARAPRPTLTPRIEGGRHLCLDCDAPIPAARIRAVPECVRCVQCAEAAEANRTSH